MAYKKYHYRNGKKYGPYYYESYRDGSGKVRKRYVGREDPSKSFSKKDLSKNKIPKKLSLNVVGRKVFSFMKFPSKKFVYVAGFLLVVLMFSFVFDFDNSISGNVVSVSSPVAMPVFRLTGFVVSGFVEEEVVIESFDNEIDLEIKESPKIGDVRVGENKNDRMEFFWGGGGIRLYFDLLNYSEFVFDVNEEFVFGVNDELIQTGYGSEGGYGWGFTGNFIRLFQGFFGLVGRVVDGGVLEEGNISLSEDSEIKGMLENLTKEELKIIADGAVVELEDSEFEVVVNESLAKEKGVEYKWGYEVELKDLNFMAMVDVSSLEEISVYDNSSLRIGNRLLSFKDLVDLGYSVRFERPLLGDLNLSVETSFPLQDLNESAESNVSFDKDKKEKKEKNKTEIVEGNVSVVNETVEGNVSDGDVNVSEGEDKVKKEKEKKEKKEKGKDDVEEVQTGYGLDVGIIGSFFGLIGRVVEGFVNESLENVEIVDVEYVNSVVVYIERDFRGVAEIGDVVFLDPSLIIIPISDAEHLDENRSYISNIYNETVVQDDVWSEVIGEGEFVRATFSEALDSSKDVSVYARVVDDCSYGDLNSSVLINGIEVPCDVYEKKKRIEELQRILSNSLSVQFLSLIMSKELNIRELLG